MLPALEGKPIRVIIRASLGPHLAATSITRRIIYLDREVLGQRGDFERILVHELFHFVWVRLANQTRRDWEGVLSREFERRAKGELGWSAEWRKLKLQAKDLSARTPAWRQYVCESFCDSAARVYSGLSEHDEFTLSPLWVRRRTAWLQNLATNGLRL
ncbi:MAG: hypothetical protein ABIR70_19105 [Bryobacteraceae bacterium]